jgi:hypothetical protein
VTMVATVSVRAVLVRVVVVVVVVVGAGEDIRSWLNISKEAHMTKVERMMAFGLAGTLAVGAASELQAAPVLTIPAMTKAAAVGEVTDARWRGRGWWRPGVVIGGIGLGLAVAPYYYSGPYYAGPYYYPYWSSGSGVCWDSGRRIVCPGSPPGN